MLKMLSTIRCNFLQKSTLNFTSLLRVHRFKTTHCIDSWTVPIRSTGFAQVDTHFTTYIKPMDPLEYIESDRLLVDEYDDSNKTTARISLNIALPEESDVVVDDAFFDEFSKDIRYNPQVNIIKRRFHLVVKGRPQRKFSFPPKDISLTIELPLQFNLQINAADDADVHISNFEGGWIYDIAIDRGDCYLSNLKSTDLHVKSSHGNIISKSHLLAEFGTLTVENAGTISVEKLQGRKFCLDSESGTISTGPLYLQRGEVSSQTGSVSLGDIHGITEIQLGEGDISVGSVSGDLQAETGKGNISLHLSQFKNVDLRTKQGNVTVTTDKPTEATAVNFKAKEISFGSDVDITMTSEDKGENFTILTATMNSPDSVPATMNSPDSIPATMNSPDSIPATMNSPDSVPATMNSPDSVPATMNSPNSVPATMNSPDSVPVSCTNTLKAEAKQGTVKVDYQDWFSSLQLNKQS